MSHRLILALLPLLLIAGCERSPDPGARAEPTATSAVAPKADLVLRNGYVYTADGAGTVAEAVAVRDGSILAVGTSDQIDRLAGPATEVIDLDGRMVLPGLHDSHIHVFGIVLPDICSLESAPLSLEEMVPVLQECIRRYELAPGEWLSVDMWSFSYGNEVSERLPHLRAALDAVSTEHPIILWGNDGHHGAVNSAALALARDAAGSVVGLSAETLRTTFAGLRDIVGVDATGEPNGEVNEHARNLFGAGPRRDPAMLVALLPEISAELARNGITSVQDASLEPDFLPGLKEFAESGAMRFRLQIANRLEPADYRDALTGEIDTAAMLGQLDAARAMFADSPLIHADAVKVYADGVLEGNPYGDPPTLPNSAMLEHYRQPLFEVDLAEGGVDVAGYVDTDSELCAETRADLARFDDAAQVASFRAEHGFHPAQCIRSRGVYADQRPFVMEYVKAADAAGFTVHIHAIGDRAVRLAVDALAQVAPADGGNPRRHALAHLQVVHPDDQRRIGALGLYLAWTYAWMLTDPEYDLTVIPFIEDVVGDGGLHDAESYYMQNVYPVRSTMNFGAVAVAGSDAPVDARSPRPFFNMAVGVTRRGPDGGVLNADQRLDIHEMIAAYTRNGARALKQESFTGTIEVGKRADLAVLDRNIVDLYDQGRSPEIAETQVEMTLFDGEVVYLKERDW